MNTTYPKASKYADLDQVYSQCSGPGGLRLAEFLADKLAIARGTWLLDVGTNRGYQTCFLAKEYGAFVIGIDPWDDRQTGRPHIAHLMENARAFGVEDRVLALRVGVPETPFADNSVDAVYCTTTLEMIRGLCGPDRYGECLAEIHRVLRPGGLFGLAEPMCLVSQVPEDLAPFVTQGKGCLADCLVTVDETVAVIQTAGFAVLEAAYVPEARSWWLEYAEHDPGCRANPEGDPKMIQVDGGRWLSLGYVMARKAP